MNTNVQTTTKRQLVPCAVVATATVAALAFGVLVPATTHAVGTPTQAEATPQYQNEINTRYQADAAFRQVLGTPIGGVQQDGEVYFQNYQNGRA